jgi:hypothetical protein
MGSDIRLPPLGNDEQRVLHQQAIDEKGPGTVLPDFETLLRFIGQDGVPVSGKYDLVPMKLLVQLNGQLARPIEIGLKRPSKSPIHTSTACTCCSGPLDWPM